MRQFLLAAVISVAAAEPHAQVMTCTVLQTMLLGNDGRQQDVSQSSQVIHPTAQDRQFSIDRQSGRMIGEVANNRDAEYWDATVLDHGSAEQSLRVLSRNKQGYSHTYYLEVHLYARASAKPFILVDNSVVSSGVCR